MIEKTAEQMFYEIGFNKIIQNDSIIKYSKREIGFKWELAFYFLNKTYEFRINKSVDVNLRQFHEPAEINSILHKAITKKMEELGWL